jgi:hypothetical protein
MAAWYVIHFNIGWAHKPQFVAGITIYYWGIKTISSHYIYTIKINTVVKHW